MDGPGIPVLHPARSCEVGALMRAFGCALIVLVVVLWIFYPYVFFH
jgi:hypothetical protein